MIGTCEIQVRDGQPHVVRADRDVLFSPELVEELTGAPALPGRQVELPGGVRYLLTAYVADPVCGTVLAGIRTDDLEDPPRDPA